MIEIEMKEWNYISDNDEMTTFSLKTRRGGKTALEKIKELHNALEEENPKYYYMSHIRAIKTITEKGRITAFIFNVSQLRGLKSSEESHIKKLASEMNIKIAKKN